MRNSNIDSISKYIGQVVKNARRLSTAQTYFFTAREFVYLNQYSSIINYLSKKHDNLVTSYLFINQDCNIILSLGSRDCSWEKEISRISNFLQLSNTRIREKIKVQSLINQPLPISDAELVTNI